MDERVGGRPARAGRGRRDVAGLDEASRELADDPAGDHVGHVEDVADVGRERARVSGVVALEFVDGLLDSVRRSSHANDRSDR
jgi:hypothetical protein